MDSKDLRIGTWNANGIRDKIEEFSVYLKENKIDICFVSETHLTKHSHIKINGYNVHHTIHPDNQANGGSAIFIKNNLKYNEDLSIQLDKVQLTALIVSSTKQHFKVGAVYLPPRHNLKEEDYMLILKHMGDRFILGGDFNAKHSLWGSRLDNTKGRELKKAIDKIGCNVHSSGKPTYWPTDRNKIPDVLDFFITKKIASNFINIEDNYDLNSDHSSIIMTLSETVIKKPIKPTLSNKTTDWESFKIQLDQEVNLDIDLATNDQLDKAVANFTELIQQTVWSNTKTVTHKTPGFNYPMEVRNLVKNKRKLRRSWHVTRDPAMKTKLNSESQKIKRLIQQLKETSANSFLENLTADKSTNYSLWKTTKKLRRKITHVPPILKGDNEYAKTDQEKADTFATHLQNIFTPNEPTTDSNECPPQTENNWHKTIKKVTLKELKRELKYNINPKKSPGYDLITGLVLKKLPTKGLKMLLLLVNATFRLMYVPAQWKIAEMIMILKPGKKATEMKSYRPISLLPIMSKLFEKIFLKRLKPIIEGKNLLPNHQFGFRQRHSTIEQVHRLIDIIEKALEGEEVCSIIFLDVSQAFDKVWHEGLLYKLNKLLPVQFVNLLKSYITDRMFRVNHETGYSDLKDIRAGVPQGSVLGPILYLLFTSDLPQTPNVVTATFADDTANAATAKTDEESALLLQRSNDLVEIWTKKWRIKLNDQKAVHVNYTNKIISNPKRLTINGNIIPYENTAKYLGMNLDAKAKWVEHTKIKLTELQIRFSQLHWILGRKSRTSTYNKLLVYNQILKPIWMYGIQLWGCASRSHISKLQRFQNKVLRTIANAPWYIRNSDLHRDLGVPLVEDIIKQIATKHKNRLMQHENPEALKLLDNNQISRRLKRTKPFELVA